MGQVQTAQVAHSNTSYTAYLSLLIARLSNIHNGVHNDNAAKISPSSPYSTLKPLPGSPLCLKKVLQHIPIPPTPSSRTTCSYLELPPDYKLLAVQNWSHYTILVFDIFHVAYDASTAHHTVDIPVLLVDSSKRRVARIPSADELQNYINGQVAKLHNYNGWDAKPPYYNDKTGAVPKYFSPCDRSLL
ncbi:predicted protein [Plenodomus lingam JN3]|uniref:Predicted protein n=1 Tax=Leptosphaeria maculans (strain JN3 / isolate v23.1.3 / race Av1-4-5-6-7-8) TaxID=985895 RepID=E4ZUR6_LEPMJ|nr:predicted protein [Plenodomus lingam JN3]CBX95145.1 predicted protein [Plenodomus lingam JN3]